MKTVGCLDSYRGGTIATVTLTSSRTGAADCQKTRTVGDLEQRQRWLAGQATNAVHGRMHGQLQKRWYCKCSMVAGCIHGVAAEKAVL